MSWNRGRLKDGFVFFSACIAFGWMINLLIMNAKDGDVTGVLIALATIVGHVGLWVHYYLTDE